MMVLCRVQCFQASLLCEKNDDKGSQLGRVETMQLLICHTATRYKALTPMKISNSIPSEQFCR